MSSEPAWVTLFAAGVLALLLPAVLVIVRETRADIAAQHRAEALLQQYLAPTELESLVRFGYIEVPSPSDPRRAYRISVGRPVVVFEDGQPCSKLCILPAEPVAGREVVLAHKLHLQAAEQDYLTRANVVWRR